MKTPLVRSIVAVWAIALFAASAREAHADAPSTAKPQTFTGNVKAVDEKDKTILVQGVWSTRTFNAGDHCKVWLEDKPDATLKQLQPGDRVEVEYRVFSGVNVASQVSQKHATFFGHISSLDAAGRTFQVKRGVMTESFRADANCKVVIRDTKDSALQDLKLGQKVSVRYAAGGKTNVAYRIEESSHVFTGTVEAIDAVAGTLRAKQLVADHKFRLAKDCQIVIDGKPDGKLSDLRIGDKLQFSYEDMDGVLVANRIALESSSRKADHEQISRAAPPSS